MDADYDAETDKRIAEELFPRSPVEEMLEPELVMRVERLDVLRESPDVLIRYLYRIVRFPETSLVLNGYRKIIERELDRRHLHRVFTLSIVSSFIAAFGVLVSASALAWTVFHRATPPAIPTTTALQMHLPQPLKVSLEQPQSTAPATPTQSTDSASSTQSATLSKPQTTPPAQQKVQ